MTALVDYWKGGIALEELIKRMENLKSDLETPFLLSLREKFEEVGKFVDRGLGELIEELGVIQENYESDLEDAKEKIKELEERIQELENEK